MEGGTHGLASRRPRSHFALTLTPAPTLSLALSLAHSLSLALLLFLAGYWSLHSSHNIFVRSTVLADGRLGTCSAPCWPLVLHLPLGSIALPSLRAPKRLLLSQYAALKMILFEGKR